MDSTITQTITFFGGLAVALILTFGGIFTALQVVQLRRAATLFPLQQAATKSYLTSFAAEIAPVVGGWSATQDKLDTATGDLKAANNKLTAALSAIDLLQKAEVAEREVNRKLDKERDQQIGELKALDSQRVREIDALNVAISAKDEKINQLVADMQTMTNVNNGLKDLVSQAQAALSAGQTKWDEERQKMQGQIDSLVAEREGWMSEITQLKDELNELRTLVGAPARKKSEQSPPVVEAAQLPPPT